LEYQIFVLVKPFLYSTTNSIDYPHEKQLLGL